MKDLQGLEEKLKDTQEKKKNMGDEMREQKNIFVNNIVSWGFCGSVWFLTKIIDLKNAAF